MAVVLVDLEGVEREDAARALGCSISALDVRLHRARPRSAKSSRRDNELPIFRHSGRSLPGGPPDPGAARGDGPHSEGLPACRALGTAEENEETIKAPAWFKENLAKALKTATENMGTEQLIPAAADEGGKWVFAAAGVYTCLLLVLFWSSPEIPNQSLAPLLLSPETSDEPQTGVVLAPHGEAVLLFLAFVLPLAFYLKTYDSVTVKAATLQLGTIALIISWILKIIERGRLEVPRAAWTMLAPALALLAWAGLRFALLGIACRLFPGF